MIILFYLVSTFLRHQYILCLYAHTVIRFGTDEFIFSSLFYQDYFILAKDSSEGSAQFW